LLFLETRLCQQIENALNRDPTKLIDSLNQLRYDDFERFSNFYSRFSRLWLIQQRIPMLIAHLNCRVYTQVPSMNPQNPLITPYLNQSVFIELNHHEGFYIVKTVFVFLCTLSLTYFVFETMKKKVVYISDINQLLVQYYLLIVEKRYSIHESFVSQEQTLNNNDEGVKWLLEPLVLSPLYPTIFFRKELFQVNRG